MQRTLGVSWERDPAKHRSVAKKLSPAFSMRSIKAKEPALQGFVDLFIERMRSLGHEEQGVDLKTVCPDKSWNEGANLTVDSGPTGSRWIYLPIWRTIESCTKSEIVSSFRWSNRT